MVVLWYRIKTWPSKRRTAIGAHWVAMTHISRDVLYLAVVSPFLGRSPYPSSRRSFSHVSVHRIPSALPQPWQRLRCWLKYRQWLQMRVNRSVIDTPFSLHTFDDGRDEIAIRVRSYEHGIPFLDDPTIHDTIDNSPNIRNRPDVGHRILRIQSRWVMSR